MALYETQQIKAGNKSYNGFGNPDGWILVIGNEPEFDTIEGRLKGRAASKFQLLARKFMWKKSAPGSEYYSRFFFIDFRQLIADSLWLNDPELIQAYCADDFVNFFKSKFVRQFPVVIFSLEMEVWDYDLDIGKLLDIPGKRKFTENFNHRQWHAVYKNKSHDNPRMAIHTRQLSAQGTNPELIEMVSSEILTFCLKRHLFVLFPDREPVIPRQAIRMGEFMEEIIHAASCAPSEAPPVECRIKKCPGTLIIHTNAQGNIEYNCTHCDKSSGEITMGTSGS